MKNLLKIIVPVVVVALMLAGSAGAVLASTIDQQQITYNGSKSATANYSEKLAQTFTAGISGPLEKVSVLISNVYDPVNLKAEIQSVDGLGKPSGTVLANATRSFSQTNGPHWVDFTFSQLPVVQDGTQYALVLYSTGGGSHNGFFTWYAIYSVDSSHPNYPGGRTWWRWQYCDWGVYNHMVDYTFKTFIGVSNTAPTVASASPNVTINESQTATNTGTYSDPDSDQIVTITASIGTISKSGTNSGTWTWSYQTTDGPAQSQTVTITADDGYSGVSTTTFQLTVNNVAPTIGPITAPIDPVAVGALITASATFTDPGTLDTHTAEWDWGDSITAGTVEQGAGFGTVTDDHTYSVPGVYSITLTVTDDDGGVGTAVYHYVVVYNPEDGFVTGGGWIDSPAGAYSADLSLSGKANFGFVSKYKKGTTTPTGNTEFQFKAGDLNFQSSSYDWLVIAGHKAMYKGTGTINGEGNYGFMLFAIDEKLTSSTDIGMFRIKIWDKDKGDVIIYDNQMGDSDDADPATAIQGGSIVIHNNK